MAYQEIRREAWQQVFDMIAHQLEGKHIELEIAGGDIGDQTEEHHAPLKGIFYDSRSDMFSVATEQLEHNISHPKAIHVDREGLQVHAVMVQDGDERKHFVRLSSPMELPEH